MMRWLSHPFGFICYILGHAWTTTTWSMNADRGCWSRLWSCPRCGDSFEQEKRGSRPLNVYDPRRPPREHA